jgi:hypothetical protein
LVDLALAGIIVTLALAIIGFIWSRISKTEDRINKLAEELMELKGFTLALLKPKEIIEKVSKDLRKEEKSKK